MLAAFSIRPSGVTGDHAEHDAVVAAINVVRASGLPNHSDPMFTTIEGEWDEVIGVIHRASDAALAYGKRVDLVIKLSIRPGHQHELTDKMAHQQNSIAD
jgi:uncharacterized protein YqgV (UPF0045/DUF77 family)